MENRFSGLEIIQMGIEIEKNGRDFYQDLSLRIKDLAVRQTFDFLAKEEEKHIAVFKKISALFVKESDLGLYSDEYFAYMNTLASEYVFTQKDTGRQIAATIREDEKAVKMAISFEKDSILFYEGIKKLVLLESVKVIEELIVQEQRHFRKLLDLDKPVS